MLFAGRGKHQEVTDPCPGMDGRQARWGLTLVLIGLVGLVVLFGALIHESTGRLAQGVGGGLAVVALPLGWALMEPGLGRDEARWWDQLGLATQLIVVLAIVSLLSALLVEAASGGSLFMGAVLVGTIAGGLALAGLLVAVVGRVAHRCGSSWGPTLLEGAVIVASLSAIFSLFVGGLVRSAAFPGADDLAAVGMLWVPLIAMLVIVGDATLRAWRTGPTPT